MEPQMPDPVPSIMRWRFKQLKKLLKETVTMTPNNGQATVRPGQRVIVDLPFNSDDACVIPQVVPPVSPRVPPTVYRLKCIHTKKTKILEKKFIFPKILKYIFYSHTKGRIHEMKIGGLN